MNGRDLCQHVQVLGECFLSLHRCCDMCYRVYLRSRVCPCRRGLNACNRFTMSCVIYVCVCVFVCVLPCPHAACHHLRISAHCWNCSQLVYDLHCHCNEVIWGSSDVEVVIMFISEIFVT